MDPSEYGVMSRCERDHWWYAGLHSLVSGFLLDQTVELHLPLMLDAGCGTGGFLMKYQSSKGHFIGLEPSSEAYPFLEASGLEYLIKADLLRLPFADCTFNAMVSLDVLCVFENEQIPLAVQEMARVMKPDASLILNLPAYSWLMSGHDEFVDNKSRFTASFMESVLKAKTFEISFIGYRNTFLFPFAAGARLILKMKTIMARSRSNPVASDVRMPPRWINAIFTRILMMENVLMRRGWRFPFGLSVFVMARKLDGLQTCDKAFFHSGQSTMGSS